MAACGRPNYHLLATSSPPMGGLTATCGRSHCHLRVDPLLPAGGLTSACGRSHWHTLRNWVVWHISEKTWVVWHSSKNSGLCDIHWRKLGGVKYIRFGFCERQRKILGCDRQQRNLGCKTDIGEFWVLWQTMAILGVGDRHWRTMCCVTDIWWKLGGVMAISKNLGCVTDF